MSSEENHAHLPRSRKGEDRKVSPSDKHCRILTYYYDWPEEVPIIEVVMIIPDEIRSPDKRERTDPDYQYPRYSKDFGLVGLIHGNHQKKGRPASQDILVYRPRVVQNETAGEITIRWKHVPVKMNDLNKVFIGMRLFRSVVFTVGEFEHTRKHGKSFQDNRTDWSSFLLGDLRAAAAKYKSVNSRMEVPSDKVWGTSLDIAQNSNPDTSCVTMITSPRGGVSRRLSVTA